MSLLRWIWAYLFDCVHSHTTWPHRNQFGLAYVCCLDCGREMPYSLEHMQIIGQDGKRNTWASRSAAAASLIISGILLLLTPQGIVHAASFTSHVNIQAQTACETEMLANMDAREVFSGEAYYVLTEVARAYGHRIPHIYIFPGSWNMAYIAASTAVDGRGKILVGQQAIERFDAIALEGFLGHEMAHLVSDNAAHGCNDYIVRSPEMEADADALAARMLGRQPVEAFLERVLALTEGQNWDAKRRLEVLR